MDIKLLTEKVKANDLKEFAENWYLDFLKGCVDLEQRKVAIGGDYHMESCEFLSNLGGNHKNIWGFNIRYLENGSNIIEFDSLVNIKPNLNKGRVVEDQSIKEEIEKLILEYIDL